MKHAIIPFCFFALLCSCGGGLSKSPVHIKQELYIFDTLSNISKVSTDVRLKQSFDAFRNSVRKRDLASLGALSTNCIHVAGRGDGTHFIEKSTFYPDYFLKLFDSVLVKRMNDTRLFGHYDRANRHIYSNPCILECSDIPDPHIVEIGVITVDRTAESEGGQVLLAFIETGSGYKFCGYSTIP